MGWLFSCNPNMDRKRTVANILDDYRHTHGRFAHLVDHSLNGNTLYMVLQNPIRRPSFVRPAPKFTAWPTEFHLHGNYRFIAVYLLKGPARGSGEGWGYKDMDESMGPVEVGCPERLLKQSQIKDNGWRERCREARRRANLRKGWAKDLKPGDILKYQRGPWVRSPETNEYELQTESVRFERNWSKTFFIGHSERGRFRYRWDMVEIPKEAA